MKNLLKFLFISLLSVLCVFSCVACTTTEEKANGIECEKFDGDDFYTVYNYQDDGSDLKSLNIENAVKAKYGDEAVVGKIKANSFTGNSTLTEIIVPTSVTEIDAGAFSEMKKLQKITLPFVGSTPNADAFINETAESEDKSVDAARTFCYIFGTDEYEYGAKITANYGKETEDFYLPASLNEITITPNESYKIPAYAFANVVQINKITLSENVTTIGEYAFSKTNSLQEIIIPSSLSTIYQGAFSENTSLKSISFSGATNLTELKNNVFYKSALESIILPTNLVSIGDSCFEETKLVSIIFPASLNLINYYAFYNCTKLNSVTFNSTELIKAKDFAFRKCSALNEDATFKGKFDISSSNNVFNED